MPNGDITIDVDVDSNAISEQIREAIDDGVKEAAKDLEDDGTKKAKQKIKEEGAVWRGELLESFQSDIQNQGDDVILTISNVSDHAAPVENGATYEDEKPPIQNLLPWVRDNLSHWIPDPDTKEWMEGFADWLRKRNDFSGWTDIELGKARWLQTKIYEEGLDPVRFMEFAEKWIRESGSLVVEGNIQDELKKRGLS